MYVPAHFSEDRITSCMTSSVQQPRDPGLDDLRRDDRQPRAADAGPRPRPYGTLIGHLAKANPHARAADPGVQTLVIFQGRTATSPRLTTRRSGSTGRSSRPGTNGGPRLRHVGGVRRSCSPAGGRHPADQPHEMPRPNPGASPTRPMISCKACCAASSASRCRSPAWRAR